jgi:hypothetical protein
MGTGSCHRDRLLYFQSLFAVATLAETGVKINGGVDLGHAYGRLGLVDNLRGDVFTYYSLTLEAVCANLLVHELRLLEALAKVSHRRRLHEVV